MEKAERNRLIGSGILMLAELVIFFFLGGDIFLTSITGGICIGVTALFALLLPSDSLGEVAGYVFGIVSFGILCLGKTGHYFWMATLIGAVIYGLCLFHRYAVESYDRNHPEANHNN